MTATASQYALIAKWNTVAALGLMLSMASYLVLQDGALPKKKKPVAVITSKEIVKKTGRQ
jgi:hypothetical protein